jgi:hypothetical protein
MAAIQRLRLAPAIVAIIMAISIGGGTNLFKQNDDQSHATASMTNGDVTVNTGYYMGRSNIRYQKVTADGGYVSTTLAFYKTGNAAAKHLCIGPEPDNDIHETFGFTSRSDCLDYFDEVEPMHKTSLATLTVLRIGWALLIGSLVLYTDKDANRAAKALALAPSLILFVGFILALVALNHKHFSSTDQITAFGVFGILAVIGDAVCVAMPGWFEDFFRSKKSLTAGGYSGAV